MSTIRKTTDRIIDDKRYRIFFFATCGLCVNLMYALYNGILGALTSSVWFGSMCAYYSILAVARFMLVSSEKKGRKEYISCRLSGVLLVILAIILIGVVTMSLILDKAVKYGEIVMITIAAYTFYKITMAIIRAVKYKKEESPLMMAVRSIGYAEVAVSLFTMQKSMLVSFGDMNGRDIFILNLLTGTAVFVFTAVLGIVMIKKGGTKRNG
ncbi:MAG: hypothetical protein Q4B31_03315 [Clostridia bacterium]|nr:hypothetical protein [Clostridia bacterium]